MEMSNEMTTKLSIHSGEMDIAMEKAQKLVDLLKEAKSLADDLASTEMDIGFSFTQLT